MTRQTIWWKIISFDSTIEFAYHKNSHWLPSQFMKLILPSTKLGCSQKIIKHFKFFRKRISLWTSKIERRQFWICGNEKEVYIDDLPISCICWFPMLADIVKLLKINYLQRLVSHHLQDFISDKVSSGSQEV